MENNVLITVVSVQTDGGSEDRMEVVYPGRGYEKDGCEYLFYRETDGEDVTRVSVQLRRDCVKVSKKGAVTVQMTFIPGSLTQAEYRTRYGTFMAETATLRAETVRTAEGTRTDLEYLLTAGGGDPLQNRLTVTVRKLGGE